MLNVATENGQVQKYVPFGPKPDAGIAVLHIQTKDMNILSNLALTDTDQMNNSTWFYSFGFFLVEELIKSMQS
jgi:hypothetical protein